MRKSLRNLMQLGIIPALGLLALAASSGITHADAPSPAAGHHLPIVSTNLSTLNSLETGLQTGPGDVMKLDGSNFGTQPGEVCLTWTRVVVHNDFTKGGQLCLTIQDWQPARIVATVPAELVGVPEQTAEVAVYPNGGTKSNSLTVGFYPTLVALRVDGTAAQGHPLTINCSQAGSDTNLCGATSGYHSSDFFDFTGELGTDVYHLQFANGWTLLADRLNVLSANDGNASLTSDPNSGATTGDIVVNWGLNGSDDSISYEMVIWAFGPAGVPMQAQ